MLATIFFWDTADRIAPGVVLENVDTATDVAMIVRKAIEKATKQAAKRRGSTQCLPDEAAAALVTLWWPQCYLVNAPLGNSVGGCIATMQQADFGPCTLREQPDHFGVALVDTKSKVGHMLYWNGRGFALPEEDFNQHQVREADLGEMGL